VRVLRKLEGDDAPAAAPPLPFTADALAATLSVLSYLCADPALLRSPSLRPLRKALAPLLAAQSGAMFRGGGAAAYAASQARKKEAAAARNRRKQEDATFLKKTALRAGRMEKLAALAAGGGEGGAPLPRVLDGAVETGAAASAAPLMLLGAPPGVGEGGGGGGGGGGGEGGGGGGGGGGEGSGAAGGETPQLHAPRACYTCKCRFRELHHFYDTLCPSCAELNFRKRNATADLRGRVALVTGGRVKIGFHVALKLLRCGARVIATSRFPRDAAARFAAAPDFSEWGGRLEVVGLDLRDLGGLEAFCATLLRELPRLDILVNNACQTVRRPAAYYAPLLPGELAPRAAVPPALEGVLARDAALEAARGAALGAAALAAGRAPPEGGGGGGGGAPAALLCDVGASAPAAAAAAVGALIAAAAPAAQVGSAALSQLHVAPEDVALDPSLLPAGATDVNGQQLDLRAHNSWTTTAEGVGTPELAEVMAINAMAPFILCARLKPIMAARVEEGGGGGVDAPYAASAHGAAPPAGLSLAEQILQDAASAGGGAGGGGAGSHQARGRPVGGAAKRPRRDVGGGSDIHGGVASHGVPASRCAFIVNVSSMEGKFYRAKLPTHPHTNMAKAALNMLTRTSAGEYAEKFIYMTAVDTGWSACAAPLSFSTCAARYYTTARAHHHQHHHPQLTRRTRWSAPCARTCAPTFPRR
jgi:NAD(P)-dependent dehydrogenase (short-subunit alcohol dehydrogenase family)